MPQDLARLAAPNVEYHPPDITSAEGGFDDWINRRRDYVGAVLSHLTDRWTPLASFIVVNFEHPEWGLTGAMVAFDPTIDMTRRQARLKRVSVIPMSELDEYVPAWHRGETVLVRRQDMSAHLQTRYNSTQMHWSLNVPVFTGEHWVGLIGAAADESGFSDRAVASFEMAAGLLTKEFTADTAWGEFVSDLTEPLLSAIPVAREMTK